MASSHVQHDTSNGAPMAGVLRDCTLSTSNAMQIQHLSSRYYQQPSSQYITRLPRDRTLRLSKKQSQSMASLSVDPALLSAKLEVARLEQNTKHTSSRTASGKEHTSRSGSQRQQRDSVRKSLPIEPEYMADGKPVYNTAQLLAALEVTSRRSSSLTRPHGYSAEPPRDTRHSEEHVRSDSKRESTEKDALAELETRHEKRFHHQEDQRQPAGRRRFAHAPGTVQLIPVKHGSQTAYERIEVPESTLLEDTDPDLIEDENGELRRPRLSKYDRPHWAQQSQNASNMGLLKQSLNNMKDKKPRPKSYIPPLGQQEQKTTIVRRSSVGSKASADITGTLIADAVNQIKKEERLRKWQSVQNFLKPSCT